MSHQCCISISSETQVAGYTKRPLGEREATSRRLSHMSCMQEAVGPLLPVKVIN